MMTLRHIVVLGGWIVGGLTMASGCSTGPKPSTLSTADVSREVPDAFTRATVGGSLVMTGTYERLVDAGIGYGDSVAHMGEVVWRELELAARLEATIYMTHCLVMASSGRNLHAMLRSCPDVDLPRDQVVGRIADELPVRLRQELEVALREIQLIVEELPEERRKYLDWYRVEAHQALEILETVKDPKA